MGKGEEGEKGRRGNVYSRNKLVHGSVINVKAECIHVCTIGRNITCM